MPEALRYNADKLQLGYWLSTQASTFIYSGCVWDRTYADDFANDNYKALRIQYALGIFARGEDTAYWLLDEAAECFGGRDALGEAFTRACMMGAAKYIRGNYMLGAPISQYIDCAARHLKAIRTTGVEYTETFINAAGETITQQLNHWDNVAWNIVMILEVMYHAADVRDDRLFHCGDFAGNKPGSTVPVFPSLMAAAEQLAEEDQDYDCYGCFDGV